MLKDSDFSNAFKNDLMMLVLNEQTAFDMLVENENQNDKLLDSNSVVSRLQTQYFALNRNSSGFKSAKIWDQNEFFEPNEVNKNIPTIVGDKYSSFATLKYYNSFDLDYPFDEDYTDDVRPFKGDKISDATLEKEFRYLKEKLNINVETSRFALKSTYKRNLFKVAFAKVKNKVLKLAKKPVNISATFKGKITLRDFYSNYKLSNAEKLVNAYDLVLKAVLKQTAKKYKSVDGKKASKEVLFASRLFANILMSRIYDLKDTNYNKKLEDCLWLQFANALNKYNYDAKELSHIVTLGANCAQDLCEKLGISKNKVVERMTKLGYKYDCIPATIYEAFLNVKQRDFSIYTQKAFEKENVVEEPVKETKKEQKAEKSADELKLAANAQALTAEKSPVAETKTVEQKEVLNKEEQKQEVEPYTAIKAPEFTKIKTASAEKVVDDVVIKYLAEKSASTANKVDTCKPNSKKLEQLKSEMGMYNLMLSYYVQATHSKTMSVKNDENYSESDISKAKRVTKGLIEQRNRIVSEVANDCAVKPVGQKTSTFMNAISKNKFGLTIREYFTKLIKGCVEHTTTNVKVDDAKTTYEIEPEQLPERTKYVPNFITIDEGEPPRSEGKTNFIIVDKGEPPKSYISKSHTSNINDGLEK